MTKKDLMEYIEELDDDCEVNVQVQNGSVLPIDSIILPPVRDEMGTIILTADCV